MSIDPHGVSTVPASSGLKQPYHLVDPSPWPIIGAVGAGCTVLGIMFAAHFGSYIFLVIGLVLVLATMFLWWRDVHARRAARRACIPPSCGSACATA